MSKMLPTTIQMRIENGQPVPDGFADKVRLDAISKDFKDGEIYEITYEHINDDCTYSQLAKVHACIREIARDTGNSFSMVKEEIKKRAGLYSKPEKLRSFSVCSKLELGSAIEACISLGDELGINVNQF